MAEAVKKAQDKIAKAEKVRKALEELYGDEGVLIVRNTTPGIVSIGFGELGDKPGMPGGIPRSNLPIVLTDFSSRETWLKANDFRAAVSKGWLVLVSKEDYDAELQKHQQRQVQLAKLAEKDAPQLTHQPAAPFADIFSEDPTGEPMTIDEESATLKPASQDPRTRQFMEYEGMEPGGAPRPNTPPGVEVMGGNISSRVLSFCEEQRRGNLSNLEAVNWLDQEERVLTDDDLVHITGHAEFESVKSQARSILATRSGKAE